MPGMISVGCKMPSGLHMELITRIEQKDAAGVVQLAGVRRDRFATLKGNSLDLAPGAKNPVLVGGYAFTDVDADKFAEWLKQNDGSSLLVDKQIIHGAKRGDAGQAKELAEVPAMFHRLDDKDMKTFKVESGRNADGGLKGDADSDASAVTRVAA